MYKRQVHTIADVALENEHYFAELDGVVGDGDFGISLANGFRKLMDEWETLDRASPGIFLKKVSMIITSRVGGVSGAIWGTGFMRAGMSVSYTHLDVYKRQHLYIPGGMYRQTNRIV